MILVARPFNWFPRIVFLTVIVIFVTYSTSCNRKAGTAWRSNDGKSFRLVDGNVGMERINLNAARGSGVWSVFGNNGTTDIHIEAQVPGGIYSDLEDNAILSSKIYHDYNDMESRWVGRTDWTYSRRFEVTETLMTKRKVVLVCEGLDTVADLFINGQEIGRGRNMFVRYIFDVKEFLEVGENLLEISFKSPVQFALEEFERHEKERGYPVPPAQLVNEFRGENKAQMIRKVQSQFSWDWGPSYPNSGVWKDIYIDGWDGAIIRDVMIFNNPSTMPPTETEDTVWELTAQVHLSIASDKAGEESGTLYFTRVPSEGDASFRSWSSDLQGSSKTVTFKSNRRLSNGDTVVKISVKVPGNEAKLWWPNGHGDPTLYTYEVLYISDKSGETSSKRIRVGFRTVELVQDFVDEKNKTWGREFYVSVNGVPIYSKGSNLIPFHVLPERITPDIVSWTLESAKEMHINMIRVWGGGMYESDLFYDLADELGILIWQDFMFACAMYPATPEYLANVNDEVETQVKRLQRHASLGLWSGNNENEGALRQNWYGTGMKFETYKADYIKLYVDTVMAKANQLDPSRECLPSSPTNGIETKEEGWVAQSPQDGRYGDAHPYNYFSDGWDWHTFIWTRYASEYGYQSFPYVETLRGVAKDFDNWTWQSAMVEHRQRHPNGQNEILNMIKSHLPIPKEPNSTVAFSSMLYLAQIMQSMNQKTQTEAYRRQVDKLDANGYGHNMGALYWQLNDIWQGASWSSFEVNGRWKMLATFMKRAMGPILPSPYKSENGDVSVELISDHEEHFEGRMRVRVFNLDSFNPLIDVVGQVDATYLTSQEVYRITADDLESVGCGKEPQSSPCLVYITIPEASIDNFLFLHYPIIKTDLKDPRLRVTNVTMTPDKKEFTISLSSKEVAPFVFLNAKDESFGKFSDNGFIMFEPVKTIKYISRDGTFNNVDEFVAQLDIISLYDVTHNA